MDAFVDELPGILNWVADGAHKNGIAAQDLFQSSVD